MVCRLTRSERRVELPLQPEGRTRMPQYEETCVAIIVMRRRFIEWIIVMDVSWKLTHSRDFDGALNGVAAVVGSGQGGDVDAGAESSQ